MAYRIEYPTTKKVRGAEKRREPVSSLIALSFMIFLMLVSALWPSGAQTLRELLIPGNTAVTAAALEDLATDLRGGEGVQEALESFCRQVTENGAP